jgi:hypothetical protein
VFRQWCLFVLTNNKQGFRKCGKANAYSTNIEFNVSAHGESTSVKGKYQREFLTCLSTLHCPMIHTFSVSPISLSFFASSYFSPLPHLPFFLSDSLSLRTRRSSVQAKGKSCLFGRCLSLLFCHPPASWVFCYLSLPVECLCLFLTCLCLSLCLTQTSRHGLTDSISILKHRDSTTTVVYTL